MAYQQKKFRTLPQKPQGNQIAQKVKKVGVDDLSDELKSSIDSALNEAFSVVLDTVSQVQTNVAEATAALSTVPVINGVLVQNVAIRANKALPINHTLGREPIGFIVTKRLHNSGNIVGEVYEDSSKRNTNRSSVLYLRSETNSGIVDIWFF